MTVESEGRLVATAVDGRPAKSPTTVGAPATRGITGRLAFVDGLRGIAALVVAVGHMVGMVPPDHPATDFAAADLEHKILWPWLFGGQMVWLFILLSGFALAWSEESRVRRGLPRTSVWLYARRRAWRILPTYYASLLLGTLVVLGLGRWLVHPSPSLDTYEPVTPSGALSHLVLVQNLDPNWLHQLNPPLWSIAVEAQLYLLFPLLMWASVRWRPYAPALALLAVAKLANHFSPIPLFGLVTWFAVGVVLAHFARRHVLPRRSVLVVAAMTGGLAFYRGPAAGETTLGQLLWLTVFSCLLVGLIGLPPGRANPPTWHSITSLGRVSYSLYAVHFPLVLLVWTTVARCGLGHQWSIVAMFGIGLPTSLVVAAVCFRYVEGPSLRRVRLSDAARR